MERRVGLPMDREAMFHERNAVLEERQSKIMEEFDRVMLLSSTTPAPLDKRKVESSAIQDIPGDGVKGNTIGPDQLLNTLTKTNDRCRSLQEEVKELTSQLDKKLESLRTLDLECQHLERERNFSQGVVKNTRLKLDKLQRQVDEQERKLQEKDMQNSNLKKQRSELELESQRLAPTPRSDPTNIQRLGQDKETLKSLLHEAQLRRPALHKQVLSDKEGRRNRALQLDKQIAHLLKVYHKQTQLITNLKKQKGLCTPWISTEP